MIANNVTATVSTRGRTHTTLPLMLVSVANQITKPCRLIIYDDNDTLEDLRDNEIFKNIFGLLTESGINWEVTVGCRRGQIHNHQRALQDVKTDWIWRLDDDNVMDSNVLFGMLEIAESQSKIGAVGPLILDPKKVMNHVLASNKIEDIFLGLNIQWNYNHKEKLVSVDHLQGSTFLFRKEAAKHGYELGLSRVGHREETIFTYEMKRAGWELMVNTEIKTWHMRYGGGGIRSDNKIALFEADEKIFKNKLKSWNIKERPTKIVPLDGGIGDHYALKNAFREVFKTNTRIIIGACYPEVFFDIPNVELISLEESKALVNVDDHNIYRWMDQRNWRQSLSLAFKKMYNV